MGRGQTTIELLILIGVSLTALSIVYEIYSDQLDSGGAAKDVMLVRTTLSRLTNSANALHLSGTGSRASVLVELPSTIVMSESIIRGPSIFVKLSNGNTILSSADVNFSGDFKKSEGVYVTGGYYASLYFDGNAVTISYEDYDLSTDTISFSAKQGSLVEKSFSIRNTSPSTAAFWVSSDFSNSPFVTMSIGSDDSSFSLSSGEVRVVDINFLISSSAMGVYSGSINVIGLVSNGTSDSNVSKTIGVSVESFLEIKSVMIYPKSAQVNIPVGDMRQVRFSVCNTSSSDFNGVSWERDSNRDANMLLWFSWEPTDSNGSTISRVKNSDCNIFDLNVTVPFSTPFGNYDSNFTVSLADGNYFTSYLYVTVSSWLYYKILFLSGKSSFDVNALWGSSFFSSTSFAHGVIPT
ncbi:MAG: hypothetical protein NTY48_04590, partial [Candidatus Diapherotrites archaeon]|nr:hypothetical protein [Candidatus Diapherotrites archaeon]